MYDMYDMYEMYEMYDMYNRNKHKINGKTMESKLTNIVNFHFQ